MNLQRFQKPLSICRTFARRVIVVVISVLPFLFIAEAVRSGYAWDRLVWADVSVTLADGQTVPIWSAQAKRHLGEKLIYNFHSWQIGSAGGDFEVRYAAAFDDLTKPGFSPELHDIRDATEPDPIPKWLFLTESGYRRPWLGPWRWQWETEDAWQSSGRRIIRRAIGIPYWCLTLASLPAPVILLARRIRSRRRKKMPGCCENCGYDLRATPERCPECGTVSPTK